MNRREFLKGSSLAFLTSAAGLNISANERKRKLIVIQLEGGLDGLSLVVPHSENKLFDLRRNLVTDDLIKISNEFALHGALKTFSNLVATNQGAVIHATNFPYTKRSHFEGQNVMQGGGKPFEYQSGWLGRALSLLSHDPTALSLDVPLIVRGSDRVTNYMPSLITAVNLDRENSFISKISALHEGVAQEKLDSLRLRYAGKGPNNRTGNQWVKGRSPTELAAYAGNELSKPNGPDAVIITIPEFDTHSNQISRMKKLVYELDQVIESFKNGLGPVWDDTLLMTLTEFGRTVQENGAKGTEHGYGSAALLAGGLVTKTEVMTDWPGLRQLHEDRDLKATIDYRSVCSACLEIAFGLDHEEIATKVFFDPKLPRLKQHIFG